MASLTPLSKGLIGLAVVGAMASAVWHLALKERFGSAPQTTPEATTPATVATPPAQDPYSPPAVATEPPAPAPPPNEASSAAATANGALSPAEHAELGRQLMERGEFAQARGHLEQAVQGGNGGAACHLGEMTLKGQGGIPANQDAAARLFQLAQSRNTICFAAGQ
ncbi:MAG: hypothetical protein A3I64_07935 [Burkholderiales bacterium RIFCSPLOWO2_02_FULL_67_64]|nr:MAG: hypothetical protein A3I64_07935 [Burkholderiales bacterium RIFCSPLOWO2_02_FULL_67_64]OGB98017.1 MAG: hypothetical protein A3G82_18025 [Burkholderiales bacterium RIFCSPLOWO2_12_FULL_67_210]